MRSVRSALGLALLLVGFACGQTAAEPVALRFAPTTLHGQSLVGRLASIELEVYADDTGVRCNDLGGADGIDAEPAPTALGRAELSGSGCPAGARFCGQLELERASSPRVFVARGLDAAGELFARACTSVSLDRGQVEVELVFQRALGEAVCGNGVIETPETCEDPGSGSCDAACSSQELLLSTGSNGNDTIDGQGERKTEPNLVATPAALIAFYTDDTTASDAGDIALRVTTPTLQTPDAPAALGASFFLPEGAAPGAAAPGTQGGAAACATSSSLLVAYETAGVDTDVALRALDASSYAGSAELLLSGEATGAVGDQRFAAIACAESAGMVAWRDTAAGRVLGRRITLPATLGRVQEIGGAGDGAVVALARRNAGWIAAWEAGRQIRYRVLGEDGTPSGGEQILEGDAMRAQPALAALPDGRVALSYLEGEEGARTVAVQRFDAEGRRIGVPVAVSAEGADMSTLAAMPSAAGGGYAAVWIAQGRVQARYLGGNQGFLLDPLAGIEDAFAADVRDDRTPRWPSAVATADALAIAWHDDAEDGGITARLLPLPSR